MVMRGKLLEMSTHEIDFDLEYSRMWDRIEGNQGCIHECINTII